MYMSDTAFLKLVLAIAGACLLACFTWLIAFLTSVAFAMVLLILVAIVAAGVYWRKELQASYVRRQEIRRAALEAAAAEEAEKEAREVEYRRQLDVARAAQERQQHRFEMYGSNLPGLQLKGTLPTDRISFWGKGSVLDIGWGLLESPLVFASAGAEDPDWDASLISADLPVALPGEYQPDQMGYWPRYSQCDPEQRAVYLQWLLGGRKDPAIELGYVFIYFYGLERRVLVDHQDFDLAVEEVLRLLEIYKSSNSFRRYAESFIWTSAWCSTRGSPLSAATLSRAVSATELWQADTLPLALAVLWKLGIPVPRRLAYVVAERDPRSLRSVVVNRRNAEFRELFKKTYRQQYGKGITLETSKRNAVIEYRPASGTLLKQQAQIRYEIPNVLGITRQFKGLVDLWNSGIDSLKDYDRLARTSPEETLTAAKYEALPRELRRGEHPEMEQWCHVKDKHADEDGWTVAPISTLATIKGYERRGTLTKRQCEEILATADCIGFGIEPDARQTGQNYKWDEMVSVLLLDEEDSGDTAAYVGASVLFRLGVSIAEADGKVDEEELKSIYDHLGRFFDLSRNHARRLEHLKHLLLKTGSSGLELAKRLNRSLTIPQRRMIGEFLVGIAAADQAITSEELHALRRAYRLLEIDPADLDRLLVTQPPSSTEEPVEIQRGAPGKQGEAIPQPAQPKDRVLRLDMVAISRIMSETREVAELLTQAMSVGEEEGEALVQNATADLDLRIPVETQQIADSQVVVLEPPVVVRFDGLDVRFCGFLEQVVSRETWPRTELSSLARQHGLMLNGAIENINQWSQEKLGDWVIDEGEDPIRIRMDLVTRSD
jgi:uncharacterized tellurite resistance protein B-like protein